MSTMVLDTMTVDQIAEIAERVADRLSPSMDRVERAIFGELDAGNHGLVRRLEDETRERVAGDARLHTRVDTELVALNTKIDKLTARINRYVAIGIGIGIGSGIGGTVIFQQITGVTP